MDKKTLELTDDFAKDIKALTDYYDVDLVPNLIMRGNNVFHGIDVIKRERIIKPK
jgi:hypothetical protein